MLTIKILPLLSFSQSASAAQTSLNISHTSRATILYINSRCPPAFFEIFFFSSLSLFILTLFGLARSKRRFAVERLLHCTAWRALPLNILRGFDRHILWHLSWTSGPTSLFIVSALYVLLQRRVFLVHSYCLRFFAPMLRIHSPTFAARESPCIG